MGESSERSTIYIRYVGDHGEVYTVFNGLEYRFAFGAKVRVPVEMARGTPDRDGLLAQSGQFEITNEEGY
jgi:hypothetical protein